MKIDSINNTENAPHYSVMLAEVLEGLNIKDDGKYLDCTFGAGGYTKAILNSKNCNVTSLDQDPNVLEYVNSVKAEFGDRFEFVQTNFANAKEKLKGTKFEGIVLDLGISSMQVDEGQRGFSFMKDGPLDMRMSGSGMSAADFIAGATEEEIANVIYKYGEEVKSRYIARAIVTAREEEKIETTSRLAEIVRSAIRGPRGKIDPATKTFQAIRIHINKELDVLEKILKDLEFLLAPGGRVVVVSFHSLEDSIVKGFFKEYSNKKIARSKYSKEKEESAPGKWLKVISRKALVPTREEVLRNVRSRSAKLRIAERLGGDYVS